MSIILQIGHLMGVALGAGGATMSDILFLMSISDNKLDRSEVKLLKKVSKIVITGLILLYITGIGFVITEEMLTPRFFAKMTVVLIATCNGFFMHQYLFPLFDQCAEKEWDILSEHVLPHAPIIASAGVISAISWFSALILGVWRTLTASYLQIITGYIGILLIGIISINLVLLLIVYHPKFVERVVQTPIEQS